MIDYEDHSEQDDDEGADEPAFIEDIDEDPDATYVVMVGNLATGYRPVGPFESFEIAQAWAEAKIGTTDLTWVEPLCDPTSPEAVKP